MDNEELEKMFFDNLFKEETKISPSLAQNILDQINDVNKEIEESDDDNE